MAEYFSKDKWKYIFHTMNHPADGYYEIRHRNRGSVPIALILVAVFSLCFSMNRIFASFIVNDVDPRTVDSLDELGAVFALYLLFCVGNWSITCLMSGEGRFKDIIITVGYALLPMIICYIIGTVFSQFVASDEEAFYYLIIAIGIAWSVFLVLIGIMQIHNYTFGKTMITLFLTFIAMLFIIFVLLLFADLVGQVYGFIYSIYTELIFRT